MFGGSRGNVLAAALRELTGAFFRANFVFETMRRRTIVDDSDVTPLLGRMLCATYILRHLDVLQFLQVLGYSPHSISRCQGNLALLFGAGFLYRHKIPHLSTGWVPYIYCLGKRSLTYLESCGFDVDFRLREWEHRHSTYQDMPHEMRLSDFLICASLLENFSPQFHLEVITHEWLIRRYYYASVAVPVQRGTRQVNITVGVVPDAFLCFVRSDGVRFPILFEMVRRFASKRRIKEKILALLSYIRGPYSKLFDERYVTVAFAVFDNNITKRNRLLEYCEQVLTEADALNMADLFRFCALPNGVLDPKQMFLHPLWHKPFDFQLVEADDAHKTKTYNKPMPLLEAI